MADGEAAALPAPSGRLEEEIAREISGTDQREAVVIDRPGGVVRSEFLRRVLHQMPSRAPGIARFELHNATIEGELDLRGAHLPLLLQFVDCHFPEPIHFSDAKITGLDFVSGSLHTISADRLTTEGSLRLLAPAYDFATTGTPTAPVGAARHYEGPRVRQVRLCGANIRGNLDLRGTRLGAEVGDRTITRPLFADGATIGGNVLLSTGFTAVGEVCLNGSTIARNLDCSAATLINMVGYSLSAAGAKIGGNALFCRPYWLKERSTDPTARRIFRSVGSLRLEGATIIGDLNCSNSRLTAAAFVFDQRVKTDPKYDDDVYAIRADGLNVGADIVFGSDAAAREDVIRDGFANYESIARAQDGVRFDVLGTVSMMNARVGGDLVLCDTRLHFPGEEPFCADGITVNGTAFLDDSYSNGIIRFVQGTLKQGLTVRRATFDVTLGSRHWLRDANTSEAALSGPACGIYAPFAQIGATFAWENIRKIAQGRNKILFWLDLAGASGGSIDDDRESWEKLDRFDVTGTVYTSLLNLSDKECGWRLRELDRQYALANQQGFPDLVMAARSIVKHVRNLAGSRKGQGAPAQDAVQPANDRAQEPLDRMQEYRQQWDADEKRMDAVAAKERTAEEAIQRFKPQPYLQLAKIFRMAGYQSASTRILVRLARNQTRYSDSNLLTVLWHWILDLGIRYGHSPLRPIVILLVWAAFSATYFDRAYWDHKIVSLKGPSPAAVTERAGAPKPASSAEPVPAFNPLLYALDTLLPIVDLNQKKAWTVNPLSEPPAQRPDRTWPSELSSVWQQRPDWGAPALLIFNTFFGWLMTTLFVVGVTGLMRSGKDSGS